jgi:predicted Zn-dependent protease
VQILAAATGVGNLGGQLMQNAAVVAIGLPNSRESEAEADAVGVQLAARAGFDPHAAVTLWEKMGKLGGSRSPEFLSTHPSPENRAAKLKEMAAKLEPDYQAAKTHPPLAQRYVNLKLGSNERVVEPPLGANERVVKPAPSPTSSN